MAQNPTTYSSATAHNLLTDNASVLTLASSSKRHRRRSMDTDASVRALAPSSVWGGSRESLPLSMLSGNMDHGLSARPSGPGYAAERASVYSSQGISAPALASERNSYYAASASHKQGQGQAAKERDIGGDGRSLKSTYRGGDADGRSVNFDGKSIGGGGGGADGASLKGYEGSVRSGVGPAPGPGSGPLGHGRNDSLSGSIGSPLTSPTVSRTPVQPSRRSEEWRDDGDAE